MAAAFLAHGMGKALVEPDWPPLSAGEVNAVLARYGLPGGTAVLLWRSPRPMSAAALVRCGGSELFVKRHHVLVRSAAQLAAEHAFAAHLRALGVAVPAVLRLADGRPRWRPATIATRCTSAPRGSTCTGTRCRGRRSPARRTPWRPGAALARFHLASTSFGLPERPPGVLTNSCAVIAAADPLAVVARLAARRPGLAGYLHGRRWRDDLTRYHLPAIRQLAPLLPALGRLWGHGDWHPSNLTWTTPAPDAGVAAVIDLGLANRTFAVHDLAVAIERSAVAWLDLPGTGQAAADIPAVDALLDGYAVGPPAHPGRACGPRRAAAGRAPRIRAVGGRVLRRRGALTGELRPRLPPSPARGSAATAT